jgi:Family of unknown function (DUF5995)
MRSTHRDAVAHAPRERAVIWLAPSSITLDGVLDGVSLAPQNGRDALAALEQVAARLHAEGDPRAAFPEVYGVITRRVLLEAEQPRSGFLEPRWIERCVGRFCARYLQTLDRSLRGLPQDCEAWRLAYQYAAAELTVPLQDVIFGISAHINYDLAIDISENIRAHGHAGDPAMLARYKHDHDLINELLRECLPECVARVRDHHGCRTMALVWRTTAPLFTRSTLVTLGLWREHVWGDVLRLLAAANDDARRAVLRAMDRRAGRIGRGIAGLSAGWLLGRAVLPRRALSALRDRLVVS